jgi:polysaccharide biosynthesis transport protein
MENKSFLNKLESINDQLNLTHYWIIFLKYKRIIILAPILFGVLGLFIALNINPIFQSQATLVIEESTKNIVNIEEVYGSQGSQGGFMNNNYINNQIQIIESDEVLTSVILDQKVNAKAVGMYQKIPKSFLSRLILKNI